MRKLMIWIVLGAAVLGIAASESLLAGAQPTDSEKISQLFKDIKHHAVEAEYDAELLESYTRSPTSWQSHSARIEQIRSHVNDLGRDFDDAKKLRAEGSEWQKQAIDEIEPLLRGMADHLSATINHLNEKQNQTKMQAWIDYVKGNREYANKAANLIRDYVDYGEAKANSEGLERQLEFTVTPGEE